jgi:cell division initiation protein
MDPNSSAQPRDPAGMGDRALGRALFGYRRRTVDELLGEIAEAIASIEVDKVQLSVRIEELEADLARRRDLERLLRNSLISTERAADAVRQRGNAEAERILQDAQGQARKLLAATLVERERIDVANRERLARLRTALATLESLLAASDEPALDEVLLDQARQAAE